MELHRDLYFVAAKVFLRKEDKLLVFLDGFDQWDIPGGRLKKDDFETSFEELVERKMREELGGDFEYILKEPIVFMRHERIEHLKDGSTTPARIFAVGYEAEFTEGEIKLASHHKKFKWVNIKTYDPSQDFSGGWLKGIQEYLAEVNS